MLRFSTFFNCGLDPATTSPSLLRHVRVVTSLTLALTVIGLPFVVRYWTLGVPYLAVAVAATLIGCLANLIVLSKTHRPRLSGNVSMTFFYLLLVFSNWTSGGFYDPNFGWLYILPLAAAVLDDLRSSWLWGGISLATALVFWQLPSWGIEVPNLIPPEQLPLQSLFNRVSAILGMTAMASAFVAIQRKIEQSLSQANQELKRESAFVKLLQEVVEAANEAPSLEATLQHCVERVCEITGWQVGHVYQPETGQPETGSSTATLNSTKIWHLSDPDRFVALRSASESSSLSEGDRFPLCLLAARELGWSTDLQTDAGPRGLLAQATGLHSTVAFPLIVDGEVLALLEFFTETTSAPDPRLLDVLEHLRSQIGRVVERKQNQKRVHDLAFYDELTKLPNRQQFHESLIQSLERARYDETVLGLLFLDLDRFKQVNDTLGHQAGDQLLKVVADRFATVLRQDDIVGRRQQNCEPFQVARLGGDEFTVVLPDIESPQEAAHVAKRLLHSLQQPIKIDGREIYTSACIGISLFPADSVDAQTLLRNADTAMYHAKRKGSGHYQFYSRSMNEEGERRLEMESSLRRALRDDKLTMFYQPLYDANLRGVVGVEALMRWCRPDGNFVASPGEFIPLAEETGLILPLGLWALEEAANQYQRWQAAARAPERIAVNMSSLQLRQEDFAERVREILERTSMPAKALELEITESALMEEGDPIWQVLHQLSELGVQLCLDDFGTGHSSLARLRLLPLNRLKIDRSFIAGIPGDSQSRSLTAAIIAMAHSLGLPVVGEGVETKEQLEFLRANHCDEIQGYLLGRPVPSTDVEPALALRTVVPLKRTGRSATANAKQRTRVAPRVDGREQSTAASV